VGPALYLARRACTLHEEAGCNIMHARNKPRMWLSLLLLLLIRDDDRRLCSNNDKLGILNRKAMDAGVEQRANCVKVKHRQGASTDCLDVVSAGSVHIYYL
jgi:hypothetical protein